MLLIIVFILIVLSASELSVMAQVSSQIGSISTILLTIFSAFIGISLVRNQGLQTIMQAKYSLEQGQIPAVQLIEGILLAIAGVTLIMPGFITDTVGILLVTPFIRRFIATQILKSKIVKATKFKSAKNGDIFEGEFEKKDDDQNRLN